MEVHPQNDGVTYDLLIETVKVWLWPRSPDVGSAPILYKNVLTGYRRRNREFGSDSGAKTLTLVSDNGELMLHAISEHGEIRGAPFYLRMIYSSTTWRTYSVQEIREYKNVPVEQVVGGDFKFQFETIT